MRCASCDVEIKPGDLCGSDGLNFFCSRCGATRFDASTQGQPDLSTQRQPEFREVFCNLYVTGFSMRVLLGTIVQAIIGLVFSAVLLVYFGFIALMLLYVILGLDLYPPLDVKSMIADVPTSIGGLIEGIIGTIVGLALFAYFGPHNLIRVKRRFSARLYVLAGRPLALVEGPPTFDPSSESGYNGIEIGEFYFDWTDCMLDVKDGDLEKLERADGLMRIWYIPREMRAWNNPRTGKLVKYNCILVWAEWRPRSASMVRPSPER